MRVDLLKDRHLQIGFYLQIKGRENSEDVFDRYNTESS